MKKRTGVFNYWSEPRGFGFIITEEPDGTYTKYFVHQSQIQKGTPAVGLPVTFITSEGKKGPLAILATVEDGGQ
jgi:cold shock CspA family protein